MPKSYAIVARNSTKIAFDNVKVFSQTRLAFDNSVFDEGSGIAVWAHDFTHFALTDELRRGVSLPLPAAFAQGGSIERWRRGSAMLPA